MIQVIHRSLDILEYIAREPEKPKLLGEIAADLNLNAGTCANILKTLVDRNYIQRLEKQKGYLLGTMAEGFTGYEGSNKKLMDAAKDEVQKITRQLNENTLIGVLKDDKRMVLLECNGNHELRATTATEKRAYTTAVGRILIAMLPDDEVENYIHKYGLPGVDEWLEAVDKKGFFKQVQKIRTQGYAVRINAQHILGFAVAIHNGEKAVASLAVYMPENRFDKRTEELSKLLKASAKKISKKLA